MQRDLFSGMVRDLLPIMMVPTQLGGGSTSDRTAPQLGWRHGAERAEPLIFNAWLLALNRALYGDELGTQWGDYLGWRPVTVKSMYDPAPGLV